MLFIHHWLRQNHILVTHKEIGNTAKRYKKHLLIHVNAITVLFIQLYLPTGNIYLYTDTVVVLSSDKGIKELYFILYKEHALFYFWNLLYMYFLAQAFLQFYYTDHKRNKIYIIQQNWHYNVCFVMCMQIMSLDTKMM